MTPRAPHAKASVPSQHRYLSTSTVATRLGVSQRTVRIWAECGEIPAIKLGRQWRINEEAFSEWLSAHEKPDKIRRK
jgi:excisionase family DNA binding protein